MLLASSAPHQRDRANGRSALTPITLIASPRLAASWSKRRVWSVQTPVSTEGTTLSAQGWSMRVRLDEEPLKKIAATTRADYFRASDAAGLKKIYSQLSLRLVLEKRQTMEITALFAGLGALLAMCAALLSLSWFNRLV